MNKTKPTNREWLVGFVLLCGNLCSVLKFENQSSVLVGCYYINLCKPEPVIKPYNHSGDDGCEKFRKTS